MVNNMIREANQRNYICMFVYFQDGINSTLVILTPAGTFFKPYFIQRKVPSIVFTESDPF